MVQYKYDAWGNVKTEVIDEAHALIAELNPYRYRSYYYDRETNLYYLNTHYYDPETGRFISQDDVSYLDPESVNGLNLYAYCGNNPVMRTDENGCDWKDVLGWIGVAVVLIVLTELTVCTLGAAAPITGVAATMIVGATIGAFIGTGASIISQGINNGWNNISGFQFFESVWAVR